MADRMSATGSRRSLLTPPVESIGCPVAADTPLGIQAFYGIYMAFATALWFSGISVLFGNSRVRALFGRIGHWFERLMGGVLLLLGIKLIITSQK